MAYLDAGVKHYVDRYAQFSVGKLRHESRGCLTEALVGVGKWNEQDYIVEIASACKQKSQQASPNFHRALLLVANFLPIHLTLSSFQVMSCPRDTAVRIVGAN